MLRFSSVNTAPAATAPSATYGDLKHGLRITLPNRPPIEDVAAPKRHLLANPRPFVRCLTRKLFTYAVERAPDYAEAKTLNALADQHLAEQKGLKDLIRDLVLHESFRAP